MKRVYMSAIATVFVCVSSTAFSQEWKPNVDKLLTDDIKAEIGKVLNNEIVIQSIEDQNEKHAHYTEADITAVDELWKTQRKNEDQYLIAAVLANPLSAYLTRLQAHSGGKFVEMFVMDNKGLNVGQSSVTSDFWQGDEAKWQKSYAKGAGTVFIDDAEYNKDLDRWTLQYNIALSNKENKAIGAATVEVNLTELARRNGTLTTKDGGSK